MVAVNQAEFCPVMPDAAGETLSARIATFVTATDAASVPADVMLGLRSSALDGIASILSGVPEPVSRHVRDMVTGYDRGDQATIIGFGGRASLAGAALVNGTLAHACDYDDSSWTMWGHPTAPVLPAALAACEHRGASGAAMLTALASASRWRRRWASLCSRATTRWGGIPRARSGSSGQRPRRPAGLS
jgi:2-methylcitrate dehydratase PrpD